MQRNISESIAFNLNDIMIKNGLSQTSLAVKCDAEGHHISQGTISNMLNVKKNTSCSLINYISICKVLGIELKDLLKPISADEADDIKITEEDFLDKNRNFITDPNNIAFKGYLQTFDVYFYQTTGKKSELLQGKLNFSHSSDNTYCSAKFKLFTGDKAEEGDKIKSIEKNYTGQLIISNTQRVAYCILTSKEIGEICFLIFSHHHLLNNKLKCIMANAVTTSSGLNRRPTIHRMCITNKSINNNPEQLTYIKGQLLLNESDILISGKRLDDFKKSENVSKQFIDILESAIQKDQYFSVPESKLASNEISEEDLIKMISLLRTYSIAPKYNKVSRKTDEFLFSLLTAVDSKVKD